MVGGGTFAARKADLLLRAGCDLTVLAESLDDDFARWVTENGIDHRKSELSEADLEGCVIVFGASSDDAENLKLHKLAKAAGIPVNVSDNSKLCDFVMPALVDRSPLLIAIGSGGRSPLLTRILKARFETSVPAAYGRLAEFAGGTDVSKFAINNLH